ncbi:MAG: RagB/SusD family nutrient uptake outer membrane protein [Dysgonamonadaceae bacterium]
MKKIIYFIGIVFLTFACKETSEGFLDAVGQTAPDVEGVFADSLYTVQFHTALYQQLGRCVSAPHSASSMIQDFKDCEQATDNSRHAYFNKSEYTSAYAKGDFTQNGINANFKHFLTTWQEMYQSIQRCNTFLKYYQKAPLSDAKKESLAGEARFLRAFYYFHLLRNYGGIPLLGDKILDPFINEYIPRGTFEDCVHYIGDELKEAVNFLPAEQNGIDYGRPTKGSALGILAKLYQLAASPLHNGGNVGTGDNRPLVGYEDYQESRWQKVVDACEQLIALNQYELVEDNATRAGYGFYLATTKRVSKERIWFWLTTNAYTYPNKHLLPPTRGGSTRAYPYHELTEAFPMIDGKSISESPLYNQDSPYDNRDPRFGYTILYNGSTWIKTLNGTKEPVYTYLQTSTDKNQDAVYVGTPTGYFFRKSCKEEYLGGTTNSEANGQSFIRYADILLTYAEALTELNVNANRTIIEEQLFKVRKRAGIQPGDDNRYGVAENLNKDKMIELILNERRIEFVNECGNWFYDLKRRKLFEKLNGQWTSAAVWTKSGDNIYTWSVQPIEQHFFDTPRMYFNAIPQKEINSSANTLIQNPGWK